MSYTTPRTHMAAVVHGCSRSGYCSGQHFVREERSYIVTSSHANDRLVTDHWTASQVELFRRSRSDRTNSTDYEMGWNLAPAYSQDSALLEAKRELVLSLIK